MEICDRKRLDFAGISSDEDEVFEMERDKPFSPARTRSGVVYMENGRLLKTKQRRKLKKLVGNNKLTRKVDDDAGELTESDNEGSFIRLKTLFRTPRDNPHHDIESSPFNTSRVNVRSSPTLASSPPLASNIAIVCSSPPAGNFNSLNLLDSPNTACSIGIPVPMSFQCKQQKTRLLFGEEEPAQSMPTRFFALKANVNPFTPNETRKRNYGEDLCSSIENSIGESTAEDDSFDENAQAKRIKMSDINVSRYAEEFIEIFDLSSGNFGKVVKVKHRLDGMNYAIKVSKKPLRPNSRDERLGMTEVFAHAAMMKHKHILRYYSSWVEAGRIYIQNEYCEGGSLDAKLDKCRAIGRYFSETEIQKLISHIGRGLNYLHKKKLVHLDVKPANILMALSGEEGLTASPLPNSPDSGHLSAEPSGLAGEAVGHMQTGLNVNYKLGDLGHVVSLRDVESGRATPEEGDCRYMAPEFMRMSSIPHGHLPKADMFSVGMTAFEVASLLVLPKNSCEGPMYSSLKRGLLPYLSLYSSGLNSVIRSLVHTDPSNRPSASSLVQHPNVDPIAAKSKYQLRTELRQNRIEDSAMENGGLCSTKRLVGNGARRSNSSCF